MGFSDRDDGVRRLADADRRPGPADRRPGRDRPGGHRRPRLGWPDLARLGPRPPRPGRRHRADQHRRAPAGRFAGAGVDPPGRDRRACAQLLCQATPAFLSHGGRAEPPAAGPGRARPGSTRPTAARDAPGHRRLRGRHPARPDPPERAPRWPTWSRRCPGSPAFPCCCCGDRATRSSPTATCATCSQRFPHADVHRFEGASHLVTEDRPDTAGVISRWVAATASQLVRRRRCRAASTAPGSPLRMPVPRWRLPASVRRSTSAPDVAVAAPRGAPRRRGGGDGRGRAAPRSASPA